MAAKRPRQARENVTEIRPPGGEAANENSPQDGFAPADNGGQPELEHAAATDAAEQILGANPLLGLDREELLAAGKRLLRLMTHQPAGAHRREPRLRARGSRHRHGPFEDRRRSARPPLQPRRLAEERLLQAAHAGLRRLARHAESRARPRRHHHRRSRARALRAAAVHRNFRADQFAARQSGRAAAHHRNARQEPAVRPAEFHRRPHQQFRHAAPGGRAQIPGRQEPRRHAGRGGVSAAKRSSSSSTRRRPISCTSGRWSSCRRRSTSSTPPIFRRAAASPNTPCSRASRLSASAGAIPPPRNATGTWRPISPPASRPSPSPAKSPAPIASTPWPRAPAASRWPRCSATSRRRATRRSRAPRCS